MVPPLLITRIIAQYHFEGGGYVAVVSGGELATAECLDAIQNMINLKRAEMSGLINLKLGDSPVLNTVPPAAVSDTGCTDPPPYLTEYFK